MINNKGNVTTRLTHIDLAFLARKEGEICGGEPPYPQCEDGLVCEFPRIISHQDPDRICVPLIGKRY